VGADTTAGAGAGAGLDGRVVSECWSDKAGTRADRIYSVAGGMVLGVAPAALLRAGSHKRLRTLSNSRADAGTATGAVRRANIRLGTRMSVSVEDQVWSRVQGAIGDRVLPRMSDQVQDHVVLRMVVRPIRLVRAEVYSQMRGQLQVKAKELV